MDNSIVTPKAVKRGRSFAMIGFVLCTVLYLLQFVVRSAPGTMSGELAGSFGVSVVVIGTLAATYYYTYALFSVISGASLDHFGARMPILTGALMLALGAVFFATDGYSVALIGRLLQGAGGAFAFTGSVYMAAVAVAPGRLASAVGIVQAAGMLGAWVGQEFIGTALQQWGLPWQHVWFTVAALICVVGAGLLGTLSGQGERASVRTGGTPVAFSLADITRPYRVVFANPQTWLCAICIGFFLLPTMVGDLIWHVPYFTTGLGLSYPRAVFSASMVPLGWVVGAPLLGWAADRLGRRKPVIIGGGLVLLGSAATVMLAPAPIASNWMLGFVFGVASGAGIIPYSMAKEVNPDTVKGSTIGAVNLIVFSLDAILGPVHGWVLNSASRGGALTGGDFREMGLICIIGIGLAWISTARN